MVGEGFFPSIRVSRTLYYIGVIMSDLQSSPEPVHSEDKVMLVLSYLGLFSLIPFFITKSEYVKWHAKQGLTLCIVAVVVSIALAILTAVLASIVGALASVMSLVSGLFSLGVLVVAVLAIIKALGGIRWPIPVVAGLAQKLFK